MNDSLDPKARDEVNEPDDAGESIYTYGTRIHRCKRCLKDGNSTTTRSKAGAEATNRTRVTVNKKLVDHSTEGFTADLLKSWGVALVSARRLYWVPMNDLSYDSKQTNSLRSRQSCSYSSDDLLNHKGVGEKAA